MAYQGVHKIVSKGSYIKSDQMMPNHKPHPLTHHGRLSSVWKGSLIYVAHLFAPNLSTPVKKGLLLSNRLGLSPPDLLRGLFRSDTRLDGIAALC